jgi:hypothetical protein
VESGSAGQVTPAPVPHVAPGVGAG